jgi:hypothetical protein
VLDLILSNYYDNLTNVNVCEPISDHQPKLKVVLTSKCLILGMVITLVLTSICRR